MMNELLQDIEWLRARYLDDKLTTPQIARMAGCSNSTAIRALRRSGIPLRTNSEAKSKANLPPVSYTEKACTNCGIVKPLEEGFYKLPAVRDGRHSWCKVCMKWLGNENVRKLRLKVVATLGGACAWHEGCTGGLGDTPVTDERILAIDHRDGGGGKHRKATANPYSYYKKMLDELDKYQLLCWNHNHLKRLEQGEHRKADVPLDVET